MCLLGPGQKGQPIYRFLVKYHLFLFANGNTQTAVNNTKLATWHTAYHTRSIKNIKLSEHFLIDFSLNFTSSTTVLKWMHTYNFQNIYM